MGRFDALTELDNPQTQKTPSPAASPPSPHKPPAQTPRKKSQEKKITAPLSQHNAGIMTPRHRETTVPQPLEKTLDTSLLTTKEKTKYGTYLTDESIEKISIRAIQLKRDSHQIVQEAINQYFERLEK